MTFTPPSVYRAVELRSGGLCEYCGAPGIAMHHDPPRSHVGKHYTYTEKEVFKTCLKCHDARLGKSRAGGRGMTHEKPCLGRNIAPPEEQLRGWGANSL